jgi:hypothetical protein
MEAQDWEYAWGYFCHECSIDCLLQEVETQTWIVGDTPAGTWVSSRNLTYVKVTPIRVSLAGANGSATDFQRISYGWVRPTTRNARHDITIHGHELLCNH